MRFVVVALLVGCGRLGFGDEPRSDAATDAILDGADASAPDTVISLVFDDDPSDGILADSSGRGFHAYCAAGVSCPTQVPGKRGMGLAFDGTQYATIPYSPELSTPGAFSIAAWVNSTDRTVDQAPFSKAYGPNDYDSWMFIVWASSPTCFETTLAGEIAQNVCAPLGLAANTWYHLAGVWDGTNKAIYVNGALALSTPGTPVAFDTHDVLIGADSNFGTVVYHWRGVLDEVHLYDRALSQAEISALAAP